MEHERDKSIECYTCGSTIISKNHSDNCETVQMYQILEETLSDNFKPMMTYGLGGCHAFIMINKNTKHLIFIHHPFFEMIKIIFNICKININLFHYCKYINFTPIIINI